MFRLYAFSVQSKCHHQNQFPTQNSFQPSERLNDNSTGPDPMQTGQKAAESNHRISKYLDEENRVQSSWNQGIR